MKLKIVRRCHPNKNSKYIISCPVFFLNLFLVKKNHKYFSFLVCHYFLPYLLVYEYSYGFVGKYLFFIKE